MESWPWEFVFFAGWMCSYLANVALYPYIKRRLEIHAGRRFKCPDCPFDFYANDPSVTLRFKQNHLATHV